MTEARGPLTGKTVALPESRELDQLSRLLEEQGATTWRSPLVSILDAPDPAPVDDWLRRLLAGEFDDVIFLTGEGLRRLLARAQRTGSRDAVVAALGRVRRITRGPKPARALHEIGLASDLPAMVPTSRGVIDSLASLTLTGRRVGVQLYGTDPGAELVAFLTRAGATVAPVAPYVYAPAIDDQHVRELIAGDAGGARRRHRLHQRFADRSALAGGAHGRHRTGAHRRARYHARGGDRSRRLRRAHGARRADRHLDQQAVRDEASGWLDRREARARAGG